MSEAAGCLPTWFLTQGLTPYSTVFRRERFGIAIAPLRLDSFQEAGRKEAPNESRNQTASQFLARNHWNKCWRPNSIYSSSEYWKPLRAISFHLTAAAREFLLLKGTEQHYGAERLKLAIERHIVCSLANLLATDQIHVGDMVCIDRDHNQPC